MTQVIINVVSNAVKFSRKGGTVTIRDERGVDSFDLIVTDSGIGMNTEDVALAVQPYGQPRKAATDMFDGVGLGLPLCIGLMALHEGQLLIYSKKDEGTTVSIRFPIKRVAD